MFTLQRMLIVLISFVGVTSALKCIACDWNIQNSTVDDNCLGAPFKTDTEQCPESNSPGERIVCETRAAFNKKSKSLERLERKCGSKHAKCNNACADGVSDCWLCCADYDTCNGFPLRTNIVVTSSAAGRSTYFCNLVGLATMWLFSLFP